MVTMNRFYQLNSKRKDATLNKGYEWSIDSMHSFKVRYKRGNCVSEIVTDLRK